MKKTSLTLKRKKNEFILIGGDIEIGIADIDASSMEVTINIKAPVDIDIWRKELIERHGISTLKRGDVIN